MGGSTRGTKGALPPHPHSKAWPLVTSQTKFPVDVLISFTAAQVWLLEHTVKVLVGQSNSVCVGPMHLPHMESCPTLLILEVLKPPMRRLQVCHTCSRWSSLTPSALQRCSPGESLFLFYFVVVVGVVESILCLQQQQHQPKLPSCSTTSSLPWICTNSYCLNNTVGKYSNHSWCQWFLNRLTVTRSDKKLSWCWQQARRV